MRNNFKVLHVLCVLVACSLGMWAQIDPLTSASIVQPLPLPGGDIADAYGLYHQFFPGPSGQTPPFDPMNADPQGITNFRGVTAMGYTLGSATDNKGNAYSVITDIRVYKGEYLGGEAVDLLTTAGYTKSELASGTFVEIWIDLWNVSLTSQLHDFSPGILPSGLFWIVKVPDSAVQLSPDGSSLHIHLEQVPEIDAFTFPPGMGNGITLFPTVSATASFDVTYSKTGNRRRIRPTSRDPLSPFNWEGEMWDATNSGTFSVAYADGSFSASGSFNSSGNFGEMGTERNGSFVRDDDFENEANDATQGLAPQKSPSSRTAMSRTSVNQNADLRNTPQLKGRFLQWPAH